MTNRAMSLRAGAAAALLTLLISADAGSQALPGATHTIFVTGIEVKGATTTDKLAPPPVNPAELSKGYGFKRPGEADKNSPQRWEVASYTFSPSYVTIRQGDTVVLTVFLVNGDEHEVMVTSPGGTPVVAKTTWNRGREYRVQFVAERAGPYQLVCSTHAPTMTTTFFALPR